MAELAEFGVANAHVEGNRLVLEGRCCRGVISIGQIFTRLHPPDAPGDEQAHSDFGMTVERIVAYGRSLDRIEEGLTAEIHFSGDYPAVLPEGWVVTTE